VFISISSIYNACVLRDDTVLCVWSDVIFVYCELSVCDYVYRRGSDLADARVFCDVSDLVDKTERVAEVLPAGLEHRTLRRSHELTELRHHLIHTHTHTHTHTHRSLRYTHHQTVFTSTKRSSCVGPRQLLISDGCPPEAAGTHEQEPGDTLARCWSWRVYCPRVEQKPPSLPGPFTASPRAFLPGSHPSPFSLQRSYPWALRETDRVYSSNNRPTATQTRLASSASLAPAAQVFPEVSPFTSPRLYFRFTLRVSATRVKIKYTESH